MSTTSMRGRLATSSGSATMRRGPANCTGDARAENCGSTRTFMPASWMRNEECPIHVTVGSVAFARSAAASVSTRGAFLSDPATVWGWYAWRREKVAGVLPNAAHRALAALEDSCERRGGRFTLVTQNVDGLHHAAGSRRVHELHGNIRRVKCFDRGHAVDAWREDETPPRCPVCGSMLRPDVVWFGE